LGGDRAGGLEDAAVFVAGFGHGGEELVDLLAAAGFHGDVDGGVAEVYAVVGAVVEGVDDVDAVGGDEGGEFGEGAGLVEEVDAEADEAAVLDEASLDDAAEEGDVDVAAADEDGGAGVVGEAGAALQEGGEGGGSGTFGEGLFAFEEGEDGAGDFVFVDGDDFVDIFLDHGEGDVAGAADGDAVGDGGSGVEGDGVVGGEGVAHGGEARGLHADDADAGLHFLDGAGDAADEAAAADGDDDGFEVFDLLEEFEADGSLPCHDERVVEGMDEGHALLFAEAGGFGAGLVVVAAVENDFGSEAAGGGDFDERRGEWHDDDRANASAGGVVGDALRVVAGAGGDDSAGGLLVGEHGDLVEGSALFEAARHLQVFKLEEDVLAGHAGEHLGVGAGGTVDRGFDARAGGEDVVEG
jgi:hypothetical protein